MAAAQPTRFRPAGELNLSTALAPYTGSWDRRSAAHLLRRAGFGGTPEDVRRAAAMSPHDAVDALLHFLGPSALPQPPMDAAPGMLGEFGGRPRMQLDDAQIKEVRMRIGQKRRQEQIALRTWWLNRMLATPAPLQEKMTLFLHGHFTSAPGKGVEAADLAVQNMLFRRYANGNFRALTLAVSRDPAMLRYLDNTRSEKSHPNENYARELMELFTLGIGNYSENDVRESARAFTGWQAPRRRGFTFNAAQHDDSTKTFLGRTGNFDGKDIVDIIFQQPAAAKLLATKLLEFFVYNDPEPELVATFAAVIRKNDFELEPTLSTLLRSNVFFSERAYRALVKSPVEFVIGSYQAFGISEADPSAIGALNRMGQVLFYPPSVKGWDGGAAWLTSQTILARENFASALMASPKMLNAPAIAGGMPAMDPHAAARRLTDTILLGDVSPASSARLVSYLSGSDVAVSGMLSGENFDERIRGAAYLTMAMPAYQLN
ncbi:MAG: DUF1800 domain-containing protein [Candidatus Velthaea sp.]